VRAPEDVEEMERQRREAAEKQAMDFKHDSASGMQGEESNSGIEGEEQPATFKRDERKVGRNEPCPCGSGKKYKACHGKIS
jgi:preprotein translocase subunit SecA